LHLHIYFFIDLCINKLLFINNQIHVHTHIHVDVHIPTCIYMYAFQTQACMYIYFHTHIYTYLQMYIHADLHTYLNVFKSTYTHIYSYVSRWLRHNYDHVQTERTENMFQFERRKSRKHVFPTESVGVLFEKVHYSVLQ